MTARARGHQRLIAAAAGIMRAADRYGVSGHPAATAALEAGIRAEAAVRALPGSPRRVTAPDPHWYEGGAGPGLVLLNGWTASGLVWPRVLLDRLEERFRVVRIDNRGTGTWRGAPVPFTIRDLARDARRVIDHLGLDRPLVVGLSMGGMIAQELALRWPRVVGGLVLVGTRPPAPEHTPAPPGVADAILAPPQPGQSREDYFRRSWGTVTGPEHVDEDDELVRLILEAVTPFRGVLAQARAIAAWRGAERLGSLSMPTVVVHGDLDPLILVRNGMRLSQLIPGARYVELAGRGHLVPFEAPEELAEVIEDLAEHGAAPRRFGRVFVSWTTPGGSDR